MHTFYNTLPWTIDFLQESSICSLRTQDVLCLIRIPYKESMNGKAKKTMRRILYFCQKSMVKNMLILCYFTSCTGVDLSVIHGYFQIILYIINRNGGFPLMRVSINNVGSLRVKHDYKENKWRDNQETPSLVF